MDLSINSGTGNNDGIFKVQFDNGNTFYYTTPAGCLSGLTYGERRLNLVGKCNNLIIQVIIGLRVDSSYKQYTTLQLELKAFLAEEAKEKVTKNCLTILRVS